MISQGEAQPVSDHDYNCSYPGSGHKATFQAPCFPEDPDLLMWSEA